MHHLCATRATTRTRCTAKASDYPVCGRIGSLSGIALISINMSFHHGRDIVEVLAENTRLFESEGF